MADGYQGDKQADDDLSADHAEKVRWFEAYEEATQEARDFAHRCRDYYDGEQWTEEELEELAERNQAPTVINRIFKKVNYLTGSEVSNRSDPKALPRTQMHEADADAITDALRFVADSEDFDRTASDSWEEKLIEGASAAVIEVEPEADEQVVKIRHVEYDRFFHDPHSKKPDFCDAKYLGVSTWWDYDEAVDWFESQPDAVDNVREVMENSRHHYADSEAHADKQSVWWDQERLRVRTTETYYKKKGVWYVCFAARGGFLIEPKPTGYKDDKGRDVCPLVADSAYVNRRCERYGLVKHMLSVQDEINKRRSKALYWQSVDRVIAERGAVTNPDEAQTEWAKPDGWVEVEPEALAKQRIQFFDGAQKSSQQYQLLAQSNSEIDMVGPDAPQIASTPGSQSGRALMMRQQIGNLEISRPMDNHRRWKRAVMRHVWWRIKQFWTSEKWLRVGDDTEKVGYRFVGLNRATTRGERIRELLEQEVPPESAVRGGGVLPARWQEALRMAGQQAQQAGQQLPPDKLQQLALSLLMQHPVVQQPMIAADTAQINADILIEESPDTAILQIEEYEAFSQSLPAYLGAVPQLAPKLLEIQLELSSHRYKRRVLELLRQPPDPSQAQAQQAQMQAQQATMQAGVAVAQANAQKSQADAQRAMAQAGAVKNDAELRAVQAAKTAAETQLLLPAQAHREHAAAAKLEAETQSSVPASAQRDMMQAKKHEAETTTHVAVVVPDESPDGAP